MGAEWAPASILVTHSSLPVLESNARKRLSSFAPINTSPPPVATDPPRLGRPVFCFSAGKLSVIPRGVCHAISPVLTLMANNRPHGGWLQGRLLTGSQKRLFPLYPDRLYARPLALFTIWLRLPKSIVLTNR